jgi:hypothetical protein
MRQEEPRALTRMGLKAKTEALEGGVAWRCWLLTLVTGQVWLIPELGCILDKLDIALALLYREF